MSEIEDVLAEQRRYYTARAAEYEEWWYRRGRYDHGADANAKWFTEAAQVQAQLDAFGPAGKVLELACGTGLWTEQLAIHASSVTAIDASAAVLEIAREKVPAANVSYFEADLFEWEPQGSYDVCFFAFWLSHVPNERLADFWAKVGRALAPGGRVFVIDSARSRSASARDHVLEAPDQELMLRRLSDGREYRIVKHWFDAETLEHELGEIGWDMQVQATEEYFIHGHGRPAKRGVS
jgi:2-polyprenyl-3-methyl-5-hydroxy-6-metoxy-1,4-benzoquinol methylase